MYWGQLGGALEAINSGTTFVLDHAHGNQTNEHGKPHDFHSDLFPVNEVLTQLFHLQQIKLYLQP